jgi:hypothetical protein
MPEGAHPLPPEPQVDHLPPRSWDWADDLPRGRGWSGIPFVDVDGQNWPLEFAAKVLEIPLKDLTDLVRIVSLQPAGVIRMASYRRQGRQPRAFEASKLIHLTEGIRRLSEELAALHSAQGSG